MFDFQGFAQFVKNYQQNMQKIGVPQDMLNDPEAVVQFMMNNGKITQQQYNAAVNQMNMLQKTPHFLQFINSFTQSLH